MAEEERQLVDLEGVRGLQIVESGTMRMRDLRLGGGCKLAYVSAGRLAEIEEWSDLLNTNQP